MINRCKWAYEELMIEYHDKEWGLPLHDDRSLFEFLILEGAQAGLSWSTILKRRKSYQIAFKGFNPSEVGTFKEEEIENLMQNSQIIRNRLKIKSAITGAKVFLEIQKDFGSFDKYIWSFVNGKPIINNFNKELFQPQINLLKLAQESGIERKDFIKDYSSNELNPYWSIKQSRKNKSWSKS